MLTPLDRCTATRVASLEVTDGQGIAVAVAGREIWLSRPDRGECQIVDESLLPVATVRWTSPQCFDKRVLPLHDGSRFVVFGDGLLELRSRDGTLIATRSHPEWGGGAGGDLFVDDHGRILAVHVSDDAPGSAEPPWIIAAYDSFSLRRLASTIVPPQAMAYTMHRTAHGAWVDAFEPPDRVAAFEARLVDDRLDLASRPSAAQMSV